MGDSGEKPPQPSEVFLKHPANFLALGAGSGLAPVAPGTFGTVAAVPLVLLLPSNPVIYALIVLITFLLGIYFCNYCTNDLRVHDHGAIVWDEWVGYFIAMFAVPKTAILVLIGFGLFRLFDVWKPWPIGPLDKRVHGGVGIMIDDVIAGVMACGLLHIGLSIGWLPG